MSQKTSVDERRRLVAQSLQVGNPGNNARDLNGGPDARGGRDQREHQIELSLEDIRPYENNPRRSVNAKFDDIKESIRTSGLRTPLTVTRRPGESHYIIEAGGNTRLLALRQLWSETRDPRYRQLVVLFRPWRSESHVLSAHLIENEQRGEMTFWDKATGIAALKERLENEQDRQLALRPLEDALHAIGLSVSSATLGLYLFATQRLRVLGEAVVGLAGLDVKGLQPRLNALRRYAQSRSSLTEDQLYAEVFEPVFRGIAQKFPHSGEFSVAATCEACEVALAEHLFEPVEVLRDALGSAPGAGGQGTAPREASADSVVAPGDPGPAQDRAPAAPEALRDRLLERVRAFATLTDLGQCIELTDAAPAGFRVSTDARSAAATPVGRRAWWLLVSLSGQADLAQAVPVPLDAAFIDWLADPSDRASRAFWEILECVRLTRSQAAGSVDPGSSSASRGA